MIRYGFENWSVPSRHIAIVAPPGAMAWQTSIVPIRRQENGVSTLCPALWCAPRTYFAFDGAQLTADAAVAARLPGASPRKDLAAKLQVRSAEDLFARWSPVPTLARHLFLDAEVRVFGPEPALPHEYETGYVRAGKPGFDPFPEAEDLARWFRAGVVTEKPLTPQVLGQLLSRQPWWFLAQALQTELPDAYPDVTGMTPITAALVAQAFAGGRVDRARRKKAPAPSRTGRGETLGIPQAANDGSLWVYQLARALSRGGGGNPRGFRRLVNLARSIVLEHDVHLDADINRTVSLRAARRHAASRGAEPLLIPLDEWAVHPPPEGLGLRVRTDAPDHELAQVALDADADAYDLRDELVTRPIHRAVNDACERDGRLASLLAILSGCGAVHGRRAKPGVSRPK